MSVFDDVKEYVQEKLESIPAGIFSNMSFEEGVETSLQTVFGTN